MRFRCVGEGGVEGGNANTPLAEPGQRRTFLKFSHDSSSAKMASEGHGIAVLISGSGKPNAPTDLLPL